MLREYDAFYDGRIRARRLRNATFIAVVIIAFMLNRAVLQLVDSFHAAHPSLFTWIDRALVIGVIGGAVFFVLIWLALLYLVLVDQWILKDMGKFRN
jgi:hypothetical protein